MTVADSTYSTATAALTAHFTAKKNLAAERYKFFCTKPTSPEESHDHWATRLRIKGADCEFNEMDLNSAITLVMTLHTHSEKLQREIIAQDMDLKKVLATARSIELTNREIAFMKQHNMEATASPTPVYAVQGKHPKAYIYTSLEGKPSRSAAIVESEHHTKGNARQWVQQAWPFVFLQVSCQSLASFAQAS